MIHTSGKNKYCQKNATKIAKSSTQKLARLHISHPAKPN